MSDSKGKKYSDILQNIKQKCLQIEFKHKAEGNIQQAGCKDIIENGFKNALIY
jgi:hypothetical protein